MMRRRRRRFGPKWTYSNSQTLLINGTTGSGPISGNFFDYAWLLPPARAQFIMNTKQRDRMQFSGAHLWLDFRWRNEGNGQNVPDVNFAVYKTIVNGTTGDIPDFSPMLGQWLQPSTPSTITSWEEDDDDGTNPFLWQHWIKGFSPPNARVQSFTNSQPMQNQANVIGDASVDVPLYLCRKFNVTQEWQPDVVIRSKRTIRKSEGVVLVMGVNSPSATMSSILDVRYRTLTK